MAKTSRNALLVVLGGSILAFSVLVSIVAARAFSASIWRAEAEEWAARQYLITSRDPVTGPLLEKTIQELRDRGQLERFSLPLIRFASDEANASAAEAPVPKTFQMIFPHTVNGQGGGIRCQSSIVAINNSETNASGEVFFYKQNGTPLSVKTNLGTGSNFKFTLLPGEAFRLETDGSGDLSVGWIEVISDIQLSGTGTYAMFDGLGRFISEVGIGDSAPATSQMIYVDTTQGSDTSYAVCNPDAATATTLDLELRTLAGAVLETKTGVTLGPRSQRAEYVREAFPARDLTNFQGVLVTRSTGAAVALVTLRGRQSRYTSLPAAAEVASPGAATTLLFGRIGDGALGNVGIRTTYLFLNHSSQPANVTVNTNGENGAALPVSMGGSAKSSFTVEVPAGGAAAITSDGATNPIAVGWAQATSDTQVAGSALFTILDQGQFVTELGAPDSPAGSRVSIYARLSNEVDTALALSNPSASSQTVTLRLIKRGATGAFGTVLSEKGWQIQGKGHVAKFISEFFAEVPEIQQRNFEGTVEAISQGEQNLAALTLRATGVQLTSLPAARFLPAAFAPKLTVSASTLLKGSTPYFSLNLSQAANDAPFDKAVIRFSEGRFDLTSLITGDQFGDLIFDIFGFLLMGKAFAGGPTEDSVEFFHILTPDGEGDIQPLVCKITNLPGGGVEFELVSNPGSGGLVPLDYKSSLCFNAGRLQLPAGAATIEIQEEYQSQEQTIGANDILKRSARSTLQTVSQGSGVPRIDAVFASRVIAGSEVDIMGANFSPTVQGNTVRVTGMVGGTRQEIDAAVLEAAPTSLRVRLPENTAPGDVAIPGAGTELKVIAGGQTSNSYSLSVPFAPLPELAFSSRTAGGNTGFKLDILQTRYELPVMDFTIKPDKGSWITQGFSVGQILGTFQVAGLSTTVFDLKVTSSAAEKLVLEAIEQGASDPAAFTLEITNSGGATMKLIPAEISITSQLGSNLTWTLEFTTAVFKMPSPAGTAFNVNLDIYSMPERTAIRETSLVATPRLSFSTN